MPRSFFEHHVLPAFRHFQAGPLEEWRAKIAAQEADNMAERVFHRYRTSDPTKVYEAKSVRQYRKLLAERECADFHIVWDIHDAHKHVEITQRAHVLTHSHQTARTIEGGGYGSGPYGAGTFGSGTPTLTVTLDDGTKREFSTIIATVIAMWERLIRDQGL